jgi:hypothetical protein
MDSLIIDVFNHIHAPNYYKYRISANLPLKFTTAKLRPCAPPLNTGPFKLSITSKLSPTTQFYNTPNIDELTIIKNCLHIKMKKSLSIRVLNCQQLPKNLEIFPDLEEITTKRIDYNYKIGDKITKLIAPNFYANNVNSDNLRHLVCQGFHSLNAKNLEYLEFTHAVLDKTANVPNLKKLVTHDDVLSVPCLSSLTSLVSFICHGYKTSLFLPPNVVDLHISTNYMYTVTHSNSIKNLRCSFYILNMFDNCKLETLELMNGVDANYVFKKFPTLKKYTNSDGVFYREKGCVISRICYADNVQMVKILNSDLSKNELKYFPHLETIHVNGWHSTANDIDFKYVPNLKHLTLDKRCSIKLDGSFLQYCPNLITLKLNKSVHIHSKYLRFVPKLRYLEMRGIYSLPIDGNDIRTLTELRQINIKGSHVTNFGVNLLENAPNIEIIDITKLIGLDVKCQAITKFVQKKIFH